VRNKGSSEGRKDNSLFRYIVTGSFGIIISWFFYSLIYQINPLQNYRATSSWFIGYNLAVVQQHYLHMKFTFHGTKNYFKSLLGAYKAYSLGLILSTIINLILIQIYQLDHQLAWLISSGCSFFVNYILLRKMAFE